MSGPLRDRIDLTVEVPSVPPDVLDGPAGGESSLAVRARVVAARERQRERYRSDHVTTNAQITPSMLTRYCVSVARSEMAGFEVSINGRF